MIADQNSNSERLVESPGLGSSRPVIIDHDVYASVIGKDRVLVQGNRGDARLMKTLVDIDDKSIAGADEVELNIMHSSSQLSR